MGMCYYDRDGNALDLHQWVILYEDPTYQRVASTHLDDTIHVSTVWLGIDTNPNPGPPLIFETMVFGGPYDQHTERYANEYDALTGHDHLVNKVKEALHHHG